jgi:hypothetical protein
MKVRSVVFGVLFALLIICPLPIYAAAGTDILHATYQQTTLLTLEADLRLHLCHLKEFSLHLLIQPPDVAEGTDSPTPLRPLGHAIAIQQERALQDAFLCREEAAEALRARLQEAEQELAEKVAAQEKLKRFVAIWLAALKVIPRIAPGRDALLSQQDDDRRSIRQRQTELEVELFWSADVQSSGASPINVCGDQKDLIGVDVKIDDAPDLNPDGPKPRNTDVVGYIFR